MNLSPQSQEIVDLLLSGADAGEGKNTIAAFDQDTRLLLKVLVDNYSEFNKASGTPRAEKCLEKFLELREEQKDQQVSPSDSSDATRSEILSSAKEASPKYRLISVTCNSFRGVAPVDEDFDFPFDGKSTLIYGPNGSGKSSLMGAITWALSGITVSDAREIKDEAALHKQDDDPQKKGTKAADWPVVATLPDGEINQTTKPKCCVTLLLQSQSDQSEIRVRRSLDKGLQVCKHEDFSDENHWVNVTDLAQYQISALDIQLSVVAPTVFGRVSVEDADSTKELVGMVLGFDGLANLGKLAGDIGRNRTSLETNIGREKSKNEDHLKESLGNAITEIPETFSERTQLKELIAAETKASSEVDSIIESLGQAQKEAETELAQLLALDLGEDVKVPDELSDSLITELENIKRDELHRFFPSLVRELSLETLLGDDPEKREEMLETQVAAYRAFIADAKKRIQTRFEWKKKEDLNAKLPLLRKAAEHYHEDENACPVCEQSLETVTQVKEELESLRDVESEYLEEPVRFFRTLKDELEEAISISIRTLARKAPAEKLIEDWQYYQENTVPESLRSIPVRYEAKISEICTSLEELATSTAEIFPNDVAEGFAKEGADFQKAVNSAETGFAVVEWLLKHIEPAKQVLAKCLTSDNEADGSLLLTLQKGRQSADEILPLKKTSTFLGQAREKLKKIKEITKKLNALTDLKTAIDRVKELKRYADTEVASRFSSVSGQTLANWEKLYPNKKSLLPSKMVVEKRGKSEVAVFLTQGGAEVPATHFANAGLQRSIALCFYFAMLENHPHGLNFIVMDDPILSLDENHRERWSRRLLCPESDSRQSIVATHQEQYAEHCKEQFTADSYFRLIDRKHCRTITCEPSRRLQKAEMMIQVGDKSSAFEMRMFVEEVYLSLESFSPEAFFFGNLTNMVNAYSAFTKPHPLASSKQNEIVARLTKPEVTSVTNPGAHKYTQPNVTIEMCEDCLRELKAVRTRLEKELKRLSTVRAHALRDAAIPSAVIQFGELPESAALAGVQVQRVATAAARNNAWVLKDGEANAILSVVDGEVVVCATNAIEPVIRSGQWVLLAPESVLPEDGDLVAVDCVNGDRLVRRIWSSRDDWTLQAINPVDPLPDHTVPKVGSPVRKIVGVIYEPSQVVSVSNPNNIVEWQSSDQFTDSVFTHLEAVEVTGESMNPIARPGQHVVIDSNPTPVNSLKNGDLAVIETHHENIGRVIKRYYQTDDGCVLVSPNPVDPHQPEVLTTEEMRQASFWKIKGVLFDSQEVEA